MKTRILPAFLANLLLKPSHAEEPGKVPKPGAAPGTVRLEAAEWREISRLADAAMQWLVAGMGSRIRASHEWVLAASHSASVSTPFELGPIGTGLSHFSGELGDGKPAELRSL
jgi:hypothetical protein